MSTMKLILTQEVTGLGSSGDSVEVKGGYGRNYLLPRGLGVVAARGAETQVEALRPPLPRARAARPRRGAGGGRGKGGPAPPPRLRAARDVRTHEEAETVAAR